MTPSKLIFNTTCSGIEGPPQQYIAQKRDFDDLLRCEGQGLIAEYTSCITLRQEGLYNGSICHISGIAGGRLP